MDDKTVKSKILSMLKDSKKDVPKMSDKSLEAKLEYYLIKINFMIVFLAQEIDKLKEKTP